jgi:anhydro-N-acetylmuramic acid kinase
MTRVLGLLSGTSVDGVDAAAASIEAAGGTLRIARLGELTLPWPGDLRERVLEARSGAAIGVGELCRLHEDLGRALGEIAAEAINRLSTVDLIASHGQTVHHAVDVDGRVRGTLQLGQPAQLAERTGLPVVADYRVRDVAAGGQGAPLVSVLDALLLADAADLEPVAALNLGGIANLTVLRPGEPALAFDCGPANTLLDAAMARAGERYDDGGRRTARGTVNPALLEALLADPYLAAAPPKSTGPERYHAGYLDAAAGMALDDLLATLAEFTAAAVAADTARYGVRRVWASGGGVHNAGLLAALRRRLAAVGAALATTDALGLPVESKEAYAFAVLGWLTWHGLPGTIPTCTGAAGPRILGTVTPGAGPLRLPAPLPDLPRSAVVVGE